MNRILGTLLSTVVCLVSTAMDSPNAELTDFDPWAQTELLEALTFLEISPDDAWKITEPKRDGAFPNRIVQDLQSNTGTKLVVDTSTFQILHFQRFHGPDLDPDRRELRTEEASREVAEAVIAKLAPQTELGAFRARFIPFSDRFAEWTTYYEFWVDQKYRGIPCRFGGIRVAVSAITGRIIAFTNLVLIPPKDLTHTIEASEARKLADEWVSENVSSDLKILSVTEPSLELVVTEEDRKKRNEVDIWSRLAWVIIIKFAGIPPGFRDACHVYFDPVTGDVIESGYEMIGKTL